MKIHTKIEVIIIALSIFLLVVGIFIFVSFNDYRSAIDQSGVANEIEVGSLNAQLIADDYLQHPGERAIKQWKVAQNEIRDLLSLNIHLDTTPEKDLIQKVKNDQISADAIFDQIVLLNNADALLSSRQEKVNQLFEELTLKTEEMSLFSSQLADFNNKEADDFLQSIITAFSVSILLFVLMLIGSFWVIWKNLKHLDELRVGAQKEKDRLDTLMQSIGDGVFAIDRAWNITLWNNAAKELTGWKAEEVVGKPFRSIIQFINKETLKEDIVFIEEAMLYGEVRKMSSHTYLTKKDGQEMPVGDSASPIFGPDSGGQATGCIIVFRDMSKEVEIEKIKEDFTFRIVHDLRSPLTVMKAVLAEEEMVRVLASKPELQEGFGLLSDATKQMLEMVNDLLESAQSKKAKTKIQKIAISDTIREITRGLSRVAIGKGVHIEYAPPSGLPLVSVPEPKHIKEIFTNLLSNATKYNKDGGTIVITHEVVDRYLKTEISDSGIGITEKNLKKLFAPYARIEEKEGIQGTGLGLYIVKKLVEDAGGKIDVTSKEGVGTTFSVHLPIGT